MRQQIELMLGMQDRMNRHVHSNWVEQDFAWYRALWLECGELIDHFGYKWWKKQTPDLAQVHLELVDIWHFGLSMLFDGRAIDTIALDLCEELQCEPLPDMGVLEAAEALAAYTLVERRFCIRRFWGLMMAAQMSFEELYRAYVGKNVLNFFRQDHGYNDGSYEKTWAGREDNVHLLELVAELDTSSPDYADRLYEALEERYLALVGAPAS